jgi:hypothetical protein
MMGSNVGLVVPAKKDALVRTHEQWERKPFCRELAAIKAPQKRLTSLHVAEENYDIKVDGQ